MSGRRGVYFVSDVHLGLDVKDPAAREARFVSFLQGIPKDTALALYMLGDIWDFWYEYRDVVPKGYARVFAALMDLIDAGVKVYFFPGKKYTFTPASRRSVSAENTCTYPLGTTSRYSYQKSQMSPSIYKARVESLGIPRRKDTKRASRAAGSFTSSPRCTSETKYTPLRPVMR